MKFGTGPKQPKAVALAGCAGSVLGCLLLPLSQEHCDCRANLPAQQAVVLPVAASGRVFIWVLRDHWDLSVSINLGK